MHYFPNFFLWNNTMNGSLVFCKLQEQKTLFLVLLNYLTTKIPFAPFTHTATGVLKEVHLTKRAEVLSCL